MKGRHAFEKVKALKALVADLEADPKKLNEENKTFQKINDPNSPDLSHQHKANSMTSPEFSSDSNFSSSSDSTIRVS